MLISLCWAVLPWRRDVKLASKVEPLFYEFDCWNQILKVESETDTKKGWEELLNFWFVHINHVVWRNNRYTCWGAYYNINWWCDNCSQVVLAIADFKHRSINQMHDLSIPFIWNLIKCFKSKILNLDWLTLLLNVNVPLSHIPRGPER